MSSPPMFEILSFRASEALILGYLSSTILDWYARRMVEVNVNFFLINAFPIPAASPDDPLAIRATEISGRLAAVDERYGEWAERVGVPVGSVTAESEKTELIAELDAVVAHLYGLDVSDLETIWDTFHTTVDHLPNLDRVLKYFEGWKS